MHFKVYSLPKKIYKKPMANYNNIATLHKMKNLRILPFLLLALACNENPESLEAKKKLLGEKKAALTELQTEIKELKASIEEMDTTATKDVATYVTLSAVTPQPFKHYLELTGTISSKENIMVSAEANGRVTSVPGKEGQRVTKGTVLVRLDNQGVSNQLAEVQAAFELAQTTWEKRKRLWEEQKIGSEIEYLQAKSNFERTRNQLGLVQTQYNNTFIKAPITGTVDAINVNEGEFVSAGTPVVRVVDLERVEIEAELSEEYLSNVKKGDTVLVKIPAIGVEQKETVDFVGQVINPANRSFTVKVGISNKSKRIKPNVLANLMINDYENKEAITVPSIAIRRDLKGDFVFVANGSGSSMVAEKHYVKTGKSFGDMTEITEGVEAGDKVVTAGFNQIGQGSSITEKKN
jgi:RND family efflux transporter MFP subunit